MSYFTDKARAVMAAAGGDPESAGPLAEWAAEAVTRTTKPAGVIVAQDGTIVAETGRLGDATYISTSEAGRLGLTYREVGLARGELSRQLGQPVIHVRYWQVCTGSGDAAAATARRMGV